MCNPALYMLSFFLFVTLHVAATCQSDAILAQLVPPVFVCKIACDEAFLHECDNVQTIPSSCIATHDPVVAAVENHCTPELLGSD